MSVEANALVARRFYEDGVNDRDWEAVADCLSPSFTHNGEQVGPDGQRRSLEGLYAAFPDVRVLLADLFGAGDRVACRMIWTGSQRGAFLGLPPSGRRATWTAISILHIAEGRISEAWVNEDDAGLLRQLGG